MGAFCKPFERGFRQKSRSFARIRFFAANVHYRRTNHWPVRNLFLRLRRFWLPRVFGVGEADVGQGGIVTGEGDAVLAELGVFELTPHIELFFETGLAFLRGAEAGGGIPSIRRGGLGACPKRPR